MATSFTHGKLHHPHVSRQQALRINVGFTCCLLHFIVISTVLSNASDLYAFIFWYSLCPSKFFQLLSIYNYNGMLTRGPIFVGQPVMHLSVMPLRWCTIWRFNKCWRGELSLYVADSGGVFLTWEFSFIIYA